MTAPERRRKPDWQILLEQYAHEAGVGPGERFRPADVSTFTDADVLNRKLVTSELIAFLDWTIQSVNPRHRPYFVSARAYLTELRARQGKVWADEIARGERSERVAAVLAMMAETGRTGEARFSELLSELESLQ